MHNKKYKTRMQMQINNIVEKTNEHPFLVPLLYVFSFFISLIEAPFNFE